jgi:hypothetical protein
MAEIGGGTAAACPRLSRWGRDGSPAVLIKEEVGRATWRRMPAVVTRKTFVMRRISCSVSLLV